MNYKEVEVKAGSKIVEKNGKFYLRTPIFDREEWINKMYLAWLEDDNACDDAWRDKTIGILVYKNGKFKLGQSTCSATDAFNRKTGIAVAYARAIGEPIPKEI